MSLPNRRGFLKFLGGVAAAVGLGAAAKASEKPKVVSRRRSGWFAYLQEKHIVVHTTEKWEVGMPVYIKPDGQLTQQFSNYPIIGVASRAADQDGYATVVLHGNAL